MPRLQSSGPPPATRLYTDHPGHISESENCVQVVSEKGAERIVYHPDYQACGLAEPLPKLDCVGCRHEFPKGRAGVAGWSTDFAFSEELITYEFIFPNYSFDTSSFLLYVQGAGRILFMNRQGFETYSVMRRIGVGQNRYRIVNLGQPESERSLPGSLLSKLTEPTLLIDVSGPLAEDDIRELQAVVIREQFHLRFQHVPKEDTAGLFDRFPRGTRPPDLGQGRLELEAFFQESASIRQAVARECRALVRTKQAVQRGDLGTALTRVAAFLTSRRTARQTIPIELRLNEARWAYVEGTATFVEYEYLMANYGEDRYPDATICNLEVSKSYFLNTGSLLCWILSRLDGPFFNSHVQPSVVVDLTSLLSLSHERLSRERDPGLDNCQDPQLESVP